MLKELFDTIFCSEIVCEGNLSAHVNSESPRTIRETFRFEDQECTLPSVFLVLWCSVAQDASSSKIFVLISSFSLNGDVKISSPSAGRSACCAGCNRPLGPTWSVWPDGEHRRRCRSWLCDRKSLTYSLFFD